MELYEPGRELHLGRFTVTVLASRHSPPVGGLNDDLGQVIDAPLRQPAGASEYKEGGAFDFLIRHDGRSILVKPSAHYVEGALDHVRAEVLFLATATLGVQDRKLQEAFYKQTVATVRPRLVVPIHWDNFFQPLTDRLEPLDSQDFSAAFRYLEKRLARERVEFCILQGFGSVILFDRSAAPPRSPQ
jgi:L-ascorbate metabolism protein UlaG (beta-lactamase superfamily)